MSQFSEPGARVTSVYQRRPVQRFYMTKGISMLILWHDAMSQTIVLESKKLMSEYVLFIGHHWKMSMIDDTFSSLDDPI